MRIRELIVSWTAVALVLSGCSTINFSANYYTPPANYKLEVRSLFDALNSKLPLRHHYRLTFIRQGHNGIPYNSGGNINLPEDMVKYVYQNFYDDRFTILACIMAHEMSHTEYNLPDKPPQAHFRTDHQAVLLLRDHTTISPEDFYKSLWVLSDYWSARKGVGGHAANAAWNVANVGSMVFLGGAYFRNWFATDVSARKKLFRRQEYGKAVKSGARFKRSETPAVVGVELPSFESLFKK